MSFKKLLIKSLALLNYIEGTIHLIVSSIGLWGCIAVKVFDIRVMTPIVENFIFGFFSILTGIVMFNMIKKKQLKGYMYHNKLYAYTPEDNREKVPISLCRDCPAGEMDGKGCIKDKSRGCWLDRR